MECNDGVTGDRELLESLMFDAEATRSAMSGWLKENFEDSPNGGPYRKYAERHVFVSLFRNCVLTVLVVSISTMHVHKTDSRPA